MPVAASSTAVETCDTNLIMGTIDISRRQLWTVVLSYVSLGRTSGIWALRAAHTQLLSPPLPCTYVTRTVQEDLKEDYFK